MLLRGAGDTLEADVVIGPIAADTIFDTFGITSSGTLKPNDALALLRIGPEYAKVAVQAEKAVLQLRWTEARVITDVDSRREALKGEMAQYDRLFAATVRRIMESGDGQSAVT